MNFFILQLGAYARYLAKTFVVALLCASSFGARAAATNNAATLSDCDAEHFQRVMHAVSGGGETAARQATAVWLNHSTIQWPGVAADHQFALYRSKTSRLGLIPGAKVTGADAQIGLALESHLTDSMLGDPIAYLPTGVRLRITEGVRDTVPTALRDQLALVQQDDEGRVIRATELQHALALDALYADAAEKHIFGANLSRNRGEVSTSFALWAPTAQAVSVCLYPSGRRAARNIVSMQFDAETGAWRMRLSRNASGEYYTYLVDVYVPGVGLVRNRVTDPYSLSLTTDSKRSYIVDLAARHLLPDGWDDVRRPERVKAAPDMAIYELHVRDFSANDATVSRRNRGKYLAFTERHSNGMRHLQALSKAGITDVHLLPVFDMASVPEQGCVTPTPFGTANAETQQETVSKTAAKDCFNWGYDPLHYSAPEGSYASSAADGAVRIREFRQMVAALHRTNLRVGMDVVYNHASASGQKLHSVLDRVVPGYYHRLNTVGQIETSTCCDNTATEHRMMAKLMIDSVVTWAKHYKIDSFRFDLMGHQPRDVMLRLQRELDVTIGHHIDLIGEGWNFGEVENGKRFIQASQLSLNGSGIGTFSDRARDAVRGGGPADGGRDLLKRQGYVNGLFYAPNSNNLMADASPTALTNARDELLRAADMVRVGLAGSVRDYRVKTYQDEDKLLADIDYNGQPAGYVSQPGEVVNYVENHDNHTLFDTNVLKLPVETSSAERARVQILALAINAFSQGTAYFHAGGEILRSKSLDRNSFDSGDWFNRIDWSYQTNYFGTGLPPKQDNERDWPYLRPLLSVAHIRPTPADIAWTRDIFHDLLRIRASSSLFRLKNAEDIRQRLRFYNTGPTQIPTVLLAHIDGTDYPSAAFKGLLYAINVDTRSHTLTVGALRNVALTPHPVVSERLRTDRRARRALFDTTTGALTLPPRTFTVFVTP